MSTRTIFVMLITLLFSLTLHAQEEQEKNVKKERTIRLYGHVYDSFTKAGLNDVFITLMRSDSTVVDTVRSHTYRPWNTTKDDAMYWISIPARPENYIIKAEHPDYETTYVNYSIKTIARNTYFDAPWHQMKRLPKNYDKEGGTLGEVTVRATKVRIVYKGDTVVYNADAFNLPDGSMLEDLIKQLDGVTLKDNGQILVNGQPIDELTLNGKEFFKGNNKVMLENLPHYIVDQVKVYHKTTELSEFLGYDKEQKKYVMDVVLKREYAQGWIFNAEVAGGSPLGEDDIRTGKDFDNRFLARLFALRYTDNSRLSFFGNTNNVNEKRKPGSDGEWSPSNMPSGETVNRQGGADLLIDQADKKWKEHLQTEIQWTDARGYRFQNEERFLADNPSVFNKSISSSRGKNLSLNAENTFSLNKPFRIENTTYFRYRRGKGLSEDMGAQLSANVENVEGRSLLDSIFSSSLNPSVKALLVNSNRNRQKTRNNWME